MSWGFNMYDTGSGNGRESTPEEMLEMCFLSLGVMINMLLALFIYSLLLPSQSLTDEYLILSLGLSFMAVPSIYSMYENLKLAETRLKDVVLQVFRATLFGFGFGLLLLSVLAFLGGMLYLANQLVNYL